MAKTATKKKDQLPAETGKALIKIPEQAFRDLEAVIEQCSVATTGSVKALRHSALITAGLKQLDLILDQAFMMEYVMPLMNNPLGFMTDKDPKRNRKCSETYDWLVVRDCVKEGLLRGFRWVNNEMNIISSRFYGAKNGFLRLINEFPGVGNYRMVPSVPKGAAGGALVICRATWDQDGRPQTLDREFAVKVNEGMGADAILGKAERKMAAAVYNVLTGAVVPEGEAGDVIDLDPATGEPRGLAAAQGPRRSRIDDLERDLAAKAAEPAAEPGPEAAQDAPEGEAGQDADQEPEEAGDGDVGDDEPPFGGDDEDEPDAAEAKMIGYVEAMEAARSMEELDAIGRRVSADSDVFDGDQLHSLKKAYKAAKARLPKAPAKATPPAADGVAATLAWNDDDAKWLILFNRELAMCTSTAEVQALVDAVKKIPGVPQNTLDMAWTAVQNKLRRFQR